MSITKEYLEQQLKGFEQELEVITGNAHRLDGAIQLVKHLLEKLNEAPEVVE